MDIFNYVLIAAGAYVLYAALALRFQNRITASLMLSPGNSESSIGDREGFRRYMFPRTAALGVLVAFGGCWDVIFPAAAGTAWAGGLAIALFTAAIVLYIRAIKKAEKNFAKRK